YTSTNTIARTVTTTATPPSCTDALPIVQNGGFEAGGLAFAPWAVLQSIPAQAYDNHSFSYDVASPGYNSDLAFIVTNDLAAPYMTVGIGHKISVCVGRRYKVSAQVFMTDGRQDPPEQYIGMSLDQFGLASSSASWIQGPPVVWKEMSGEFTAGQYVASSGTGTLIFSFTATSFLSAKWGVDNVVVTPI
ncbi:MAG: hypothetical protein Q9208_008424, partial [Pyrenodesmia sp. 3 TL-2023]